MSKTTTEARVSPFNHLNPSKLEEYKAKFQLQTSCKQSNFSFSGNISNWQGLLDKNDIDNQQEIIELAELAYKELCDLVAPIMNEPGEYFRRYRKPEELREKFMSKESAKHENYMREGFGAIRMPKQGVVAQCKMFEEKKAAFDDAIKTYEDKLKVLAEKANISPEDLQGLINKSELYR